MKLFKTKKEGSCCQSGCCDEAPSVTNAAVKVLGSGCKNCTVLAENTKEALIELNLPADIEKVTDMKDIASYGVLSTPALVYNNKVLSYGKVLTKDQVKALLEDAQ